MQSCVCAAVGPGQTSLFGNTQNKMGTTLGTMGTFGATGFNTGASTLGFGTPQQPVGEQLETTKKTTLMCSVLLKHQESQTSQHYREIIQLNSTERTIAAQVTEYITGETSPELPLSPPTAITCHDPVCSDG